jgi:prophage regulatory protein
MKYLSFLELRQKLGGRGRTTVYRDVEEGRLPKPIKLGGRLLWVESQVDEALNSMLHVAKPEAV